MAAYISVPRDLTRVKSKILFNLTKRQLICFSVAAIVGVPVFFLLKRTGNVSLATLGMMLFMLPMQMTMGYFYTFYAPWFKEIGGSDALLGLGYLLSAASEAPYLLFSARIYRRFGAAKPMCAAAGLLAGRWLLLGLARGPVAALLSQLLHGGGFIVITVSMAYWISDQVPDELRASGQALLNMVTFGVARISGNLLGGALAQALGRGGAFIAAAGVCAAAAVLLIAFMLCTKTGRALEGR